MILLLNMMFFSRLIAMLLSLILKKHRSQTFVMSTYAIEKVFECFATQCSLNKHKSRSVK